MASEKSSSCITLPQDQYAHPTAPCEFWFHIGTLVCSDGARKGDKFGFEVNVTAKQPENVGFAQIQITDLVKKCIYRKAPSDVPLPPNYAEKDPTLPWFVKLYGSEDSKDGTVLMNDDPLKMHVVAHFTDVEECEINLFLQQEGQPLLFWKDGRELVDNEADTDLKKYSYYYSLTNLQVHGFLKIGGDTFKVVGRTWMDHQYGALPLGGAFMIQMIQLESGESLANFILIETPPAINESISSSLSILSLDGQTTHTEGKTTPMSPTYTSGKGVEYFLKFQIAFENRSLIVQSSMENQVGSDITGGEAYEGVGQCVAFFDNPTVVSGAAWLEEVLTSSKGKAEK